MLQKHWSESTHIIVPLRPPTSMEEKNDYKMSLFPSTYLQLVLAWPWKEIRHNTQLNADRVIFMVRLYCDNFEKSTVWVKWKKNVSENHKKIWRYFKVRCNKLILILFFNICSYLNSDSVDSKGSKKIPYMFLKFIFISLNTPPKGLCTVKNPHVSQILVCSSPHRECCHSFRFCSETDLIQTYWSEHFDIWTAAGI